MCVTQKISEWSVNSGDLVRLEIENCSEGRRGCRGCSRSLGGVVDLAIMPVENPSRSRTAFFLLGGCLIGETLG